MKVLMFEPTGGFWPYVPELSTALVDEGVDLFFLSSQLRQDEKVKNVQFLPIARTMNRQLFRRFSPSWFIDRISTGFQWINVRKKTISKICPEIVHIQSTISVLDQFFINEVKKTAKVVLTVHDVLPITDSIANRSKRGMAKILHAADQLIVHSAQNKIELIEKFSIDENRIAVIPHGVSVGNLVDKKAARNRVGIEAEGKYFLLFGGLRRSKGFDLGIQAFAELKKTDLSGKVRLLIAGAAQSEAEMQVVHQAVAASGVSDHIFIHSQYIAEDQVPSYFCAADVVLLPYTKFHSQSGVLLQAYKYGVPVVVTNTGSLGETVFEDGSGLVVQDFLPETMAASMVKLLCDCSMYQRCVSNQKRLAEEKYGWSRVAQKTKMLYEKIIQ